MMTLLTLLVVVLKMLGRTEEQSWYCDTQLNLNLGVQSCGLGLVYVTKLVQQIINA